MSANGINMQEQILENLTTAVLVFDSNLKVQSINPAAEAALAISDRRVHGLHVEDLFYESPSSVNDFKQSMATGNGYNKREAQLVASAANGELSKDSSAQGKMSFT